MAWPAVPLLKELKKYVYSKGAACSHLSIRVCSRREQSHCCLLGRYQLGEFKVGAGAPFQLLPSSCAWGMGTPSRFLVRATEQIESSCLGDGGKNTQNVDLHPSLAVNEAW